MLKSLPATPPGLSRLFIAHRAFCEKKTAQHERLVWLLRVAEEIDGRNRIQVSDATDEHNRWLLRVSAEIDTRIQTDAILSDSDLD